MFHQFKESGEKYGQLMQRHPSQSWEAARGQGIDTVWIYYNEIEIQEVIKESILISWLVGLNPSISLVGFSKVIGFQ